MYALNFYSPIVADQLRSRRKTATIRLGDKSRKYKKGMVVQVLVGARYGPRQKVFDAVIDKVEVKTLAELSPRDIEHDNPEARRPEALPAGFAFDCEDRAEARIAGRAPRAHLAAALRARRGELTFGVVEVARREAARDAEGHPVAERLAALLAEPVGRLAH